MRKTILPEFRLDFPVTIFMSPLGPPPTPQVSMATLPPPISSPPPAFKKRCPPLFTEEPASMDTFPPIIPCILLLPAMRRIEPGIIALPDWSMISPAFDSPSESPVSIRTPPVPCSPSLDWMEISPLLPPERLRPLSI